MSRGSYGAQMQEIAAAKAMREIYFDPTTVEAGARVPYRDDDATDDREWDDAERLLARRGLRLRDDGSGYVVTAD